MPMRVHEAPCTVYPMNLEMPPADGMTYSVGITE